MSLCIMVAGGELVVAAAAFTLSWTHSVERTAWEEEWRVTPAGLVLDEARISGSGAGMEPPDGAVLRNGAWVYRPDLRPQARLVLAASGATGGGWRLCTVHECFELGAERARPVEIAPCR